MNTKSAFLFLSLLTVSIFTSCNQPPETFELAMEKYDSKDFEGSIDLFKLTPIEDKNWYDSSFTMINAAIGNIFELEDLDRITAFCRSKQYDSLISPILVSELKEYWSAQLKSKPTFTFSMYDSVNFMFDVDPEKELLLRKNEDAYFSGLWVCPKGKTKGKEIYFERNKKSNLINGISNKSGDGWDKGKIIYKDIFYKGDLVLDHKVRVFTTSFWGGTSESFTRTKGKMTILSNDSLLIDYEGSVNSNNKVIFIRKNK